MSKTMGFKIEECKHGNWQIREKAVLDIGTFYLLEDSDGFYRNKQIAHESGDIIRAWVYTDTLGFYAAVTRGIGDEFENAFSAAYRRWVIDKFRKAFPVAEEHFFCTTPYKCETKEEAESRKKARYAEAENSLELAAFAYKKLSLSPATALCLFGNALLGERHPICGYSVENVIGYARDDKQLLEKVWRIMCEMQEAYHKGVFEYPFYN